MALSRKPRHYEYHYKIQVWHDSSMKCICMLISKVKKLLLFTENTSTVSVTNSKTATNEGKEENLPKKMKVDVDSVDVAIEFEVCSGGSSCELQWLFSSSSNIKLSTDDKTVLTKG